MFNTSVQKKKVNPGHSHHFQRHRAHAVAPGVALGFAFWQGSCGNLTRENYDHLMVILGANLFKPISRHFMIFTTEKEVRSS